MRPVRKPMSSREITKKGWNIESKVVSLLGEEAKQTKENKLYDIYYKGQQIEVKSAELRIKDGKSNGTRWGRFIASKNTHNILKKCDGWYALVLTFKKNPLLIRFVKSTNVHLVVSNYTGKLACIPLEALYFGLSLEEFRGSLDG